MACAMPANELQPASHVAAVATTSCHTATACAECCKRLVPQLHAPKLKCTVVAACCLSCTVPPLSLMRSAAAVPHPQHRNSGSIYQLSVALLVVMPL